MPLGPGHCIFVPGTASVPRSSRGRFRRSSRIIRLIRDAYGGEVEAPERHAESWGAAPTFPRRRTTTNERVHVPSVSSFGSPAVLWRMRIIWGVCVIILLFANAVD